MNFRLHTITLTRKDTGEGITEIYQNQEEAVNYMLALAGINGIEMKKKVSTIDDDFVEFFRGENRKSVITFRIYNIKVRTNESKE